MSKLVSINLEGQYINNKNIIDCLKQSQCKYVFDGEVALGMKDGDDVNIGFHYVGNDKNIDDIFKRWPDIASINVEMNIDGWIQGITFFLNKKNNISFSLEGDRKELSSGITDLSWYLNHMIPNLIDGKFKITSVVFEEHQ